MVRNTAHGGTLFQAAILAGKGQLQFMGYQLSIVKEHLVEIAQSEEQNAVLILGLHIQILLHHGRYVGHGSSSLCAFHF